MGMDESAAVVAAHACMLVAVVYLAALVTPWFRASWRELVRLPAGGLVFGGVGAFGYLGWEAAYYGGGRVARHTADVDVWFGFGAVAIALSKLVPLLAIVAFVAGCWRLLDGVDCDEARRRALRMVACLAAIWLLVFGLLR